MSRIGKLPVVIPAGVEVTVAEGNLVTVKGPKGTLVRQFAQEMTITQEAGQVVVNIINKSNTETSMFGDDKESEADKAVEDLTSSTAVMDVLGLEADKVEQGQSSTVKDFIDDMNNDDKLAFENAIINMEDGNDKTTLASSFETFLECGSKI